MANKVVTSGSCQTTKPKVILKVQQMFSTSPWDHLRNHKFPFLLRRTSPSLSATPCLEFAVVAQAGFSQDSLIALDNRILRAKRLIDPGVWSSPRIESQKVRKSENSFQKQNRHWMDILLPFSELTNRGKVVLIRLLRQTPRQGSYLSVPVCISKKELERTHGRSPQM